MAPRRKPLPDLKDRLQAIVGQAGLALSQVLDALAGVVLSDREFDGIFVHLKRAVNTIEAQAQRDRAVASVASFSFENVAQERPKPVYRDVHREPDESPGDRMIRVEREIDQERGQLTREALAAGGAPGDVPRVVASTDKQPWVKPTGRIAKNSPNVERAGQVTHALLKSEPLKGTRVDQAAGINFINDKE